MNLDKLIPWEEFEKNQYVVFPTAEDWEEDVVGLRPFYDDPVKNPLPTPSGKLEFYCDRIAKYYPADEERPSIPKWVEKSEMHDERRDSLARQCLSASAHVQPRTLAGARPGRRHHLEPGSDHLQGDGVGRLHVRAALDPSLLRPKSAASRWETS